MKYIIDIPEGKYWIQCYSALDNDADFEGRMFCIDNLEPYTEPDIEAIENEVWDLARKVEAMTYIDVRDIFGIEEDNSAWLFNLLPYREAKARYEKWEAEKNSIHIGDEVEVQNRLGIVVWVGIGECRVLMSFGHIGTYKNDQVKRTGKTYPELEEFLD